MGHAPLRQWGEGGTIFRLVLAMPNSRDLHRTFLKRTALVFLLILPAFAGEGPRAPMQARFQDSAMYRWLQKPVLETRLLDDMENPATWAHSGFGEMTFTRERAIDGHESLRLQGTLGLTAGYHSTTMTA